MDLKLYYITETLNTLFSIPSPSGNTEDAIFFIKKEFENMGVATRLTNKGALVATIEGKNKDKEITLAAHVDTLGAMVKEVKANGRIKISKIGGYSLNTVEGEYVTIETLNKDLYTGTLLSNKSSVHVHGDKVSKADRDEENMEIRLDEKVNTPEDIEKLGIAVGDFIYFDTRTTFTASGFIKSRYLDNKAGVVCLLSICKDLIDNGIIPNYTVNFFISNYEEVGHGGSSGISDKTFEFLAIDMAAVGEGQSSDEFGVTICAKDSTGPYDYQLRKHLISLAQNQGLNYNLDIYPYYGSDVSASLRAGYDFKFALIGPGVDASHSLERTHIEALQNTIKLAKLYIIKR